MHLLIAAFLALVTLSAAGAEDARVLVFSDEFDRDGLPDPAKWDYEVGKVRNQERQHYTEARIENARIADGLLAITARKEPFEGADVTSASLTTRTTFTFTYGEVEVRAKVPVGRGTWPAIWMLGANMSAVGWPKCGEIDILEHVGYDRNMVHFTAHTERFNHTRNNGKGRGVPLNAPDEDFHLYGITWDRARIRFLLDGKQVHEYVNDGGGVDSWPFDAPQYLILNLAIGGAWGGQKGIDEAIFPSTFLIDYVRIYRPRE